MGYLRITPQGKGKDQPVNESVAPICQPGLPMMKVKQPLLIHKAVSIWIVME